MGGLHTHPIISRIAAIMFCWEYSQVMHSYTSFRSVDNSEPMHAGDSSMGGLHTHPNSHNNVLLGIFTGHALVSGLWTI